MACGYKHKYICIVSTKYDCVVMVKKDIIIKPLTGNQYDAIRSNADFVVLTGNGGSGKSFGLGYAPISYLINNPGAKIMWFMRNVGDFWDAGNAADTLRSMYPLISRNYKIQPHDPIGEVIKGQEDMGVKFFNGSEIKFQHLANESYEAIDKTFKGKQIKKAIFEECNKFNWRTISICQTRLRADTNGKAQIYLAQNPERECFLRKLCGCGKNGGGWIADDGRPIAEMNARVRYFYIVKGNLDEVYWGDTKKEVYDKAHDVLDAYLATNPDMSYEDFILSMVFYTFDIRDNKNMLAKNKGYRKWVSSSALSESMFETNWNFSITDQAVEETSTEGGMSIDDIRRMFRNETSKDDTKKRVTVDYASTGEDNMVLMYWEGFHCADIGYSMKNTPLEAVGIIKNFLSKHGCDESNLIVDVQGASLFLKEVFNLNSTVGSGYAFSGSVQASNRGKNIYERFKDEAAHLAYQMIRSGIITFRPELANMAYTHQRLKREGATTVQKQLEFESHIWVFAKTPTGHLQFQGKIAQHSHLKGMSPDLTDNIIMLCGARYYDCYKLLAGHAGSSYKSMDARDVLKIIDFNRNENVLRNEPKIEVSEKIFEILDQI